MNQDTQVASDQNAMADLGTDIVSHVSALVQRLAEFNPDLALWLVTDLCVTALERSATQEGLNPNGRVDCFLDDRNNRLLTLHEAPEPPRFKLEL